MGITVFYYCKECNRVYYFDKNPMDLTCKQCTALKGVWCGLYTCLIGKRYESGGN